MLFNGTLIATTQIIGISPIYSVPDQYGLSFYIYYEVITKQNKIKITSASFDAHNRPEADIAKFESEYIHRYEQIAKLLGESISFKANALKNSLILNNSLLPLTNFD